MVYFHDVFFSMPEMQEYYRLKDKAAQAHKEAMERAQEKVVPALIEKYKPLLLQFFPEGADVEFQGKVAWVPYYQDQEMGSDYDIPEHLTGEITAKFNEHIITWNSPHPILEDEFDEELQDFVVVCNIEPEVRLEDVRLLVDGKTRFKCLQGEWIWYGRDCTPDTDPCKALQALLSQLDEKEGDTENV